MAQHDYVIANGTGAAVRSDLNSALAAIVSQNSGATAPSTTYAYQWWADTTTGLLKLRNAANNGWITLFQLDGEWSTIALENGSAAAPSIYFKDSGTDTGVYSPGTDQVAISTGGTGRLFVDSSGRVGLGTSSPSATLHVATVGNPEILIGGTQTPILSFVGGAASDPLIGYAVGALRFGTVSGAAGAGFTERMRIDTSGRVGIGSTTPAGILEIASQDSTNDNGLYITADGSSFGYASNIYFRSKLTTGGSIGVAAKIRAELVSANNAGLLFFTTAGGTNTEKARLTHDGKLLVGTSTATANGGVLELSGGITFPATQVAASNANTLDDYEEGTWTPAISGDGTLFAGTTYVARNGVYRKIGSLVFLSYDIDVTLTGTLSGAATISGLPFSVPSSGDLRNGGGSIGYVTGIQQNYVYQSNYPQNNSAYLYIIGRTAASNATTVPSSSNFFANGLRITGQAWYSV